MSLPRTPSVGLNGKRKLVAGTSSGIGCACATALGQARVSAKPGALFNTIDPTVIQATLTERTCNNPDRTNWRDQKITLRRIGETTHSIGPVIYLASNASAPTTCTQLLTDGGWSAG
ncbi:MAG: SDR family oxidoreductase [Pseudomonadota bacterium]